mmetsp:Transcript_45025/g.119383  ORF Transcript_45025/g.119383 Transcript_45025/m.119383 type:complete len:240 (-) Transcript_45025:970-1689(-)
MRLDNFVFSSSFTFNFSRFLEIASRILRRSNSPFSKESDADDTFSEAASSISLCSTSFSAKKSASFCSVATLACKAALWSDMSLSCLFISSTERLRFSFRSVACLRLFLSSFILATCPPECESVFVFCVSTLAISSSTERISSVRFAAIIFSCLIFCSKSTISCFRRALSDFTSLTFCSTALISTDLVFTSFVFITPSITIMSMSLSSCSNCFSNVSRFREPRSDPARPSISCSTTFFS